MAEGWFSRGGRLLRRLAVQWRGRARRVYRRLQHRYGPGYSRSMLMIVALTLFLPIPGTSLIAAALLIAIAESRRAVTGRRAPPAETRAVEIVAEAGH